MPFKAVIPDVWPLEGDIKSTKERNFSTAVNPMLNYPSPGHMQECCSYSTSIGPNDQVERLNNDCEFLAFLALLKEMELEAAKEHAKKKRLFRITILEDS